MPSALESYGAKPTKASRLLATMSAHCLDRSPVEFLAHADRVLSVALQVGNAGVAAQGTADLHLRAHHQQDGQHAGAGTIKHPQARLQRQRAYRQAGPRTLSALTSSDPFDAIMHASYESARIGVRAGGYQGSGRGA